MFLALLNNCAPFNIRLVFRGIIRLTAPSASERAHWYKRMSSRFAEYMNDLKISILSRKYCSLLVHSSVKAPYYQALESRRVIARSEAHVRLTFKWLCFSIIPMWNNRDNIWHFKNEHGEEEEGKKKNPSAGIRHGRRCFMSHQCFPH